MKEFTLRIGSNMYRLTTPSARQSQELLDYAKTQMPDPVQQVLDTAKQLPDGPVKDSFLGRHLDAAFERKKLRGTFSDPDYQEWVQSPDGIRKMFGAMFRVHHPHLTPDEIIDLLESADEAELTRLVDDIQKAATKVPMAEEDVERKYFRPRGTVARAKAK